jgi:hypothetical protein
LRGQLVFPAWWSVGAASNWPAKSARPKMRQLRSEAWEKSSMSEGG